MTDPATTLEYRLARTVVKVDGTVSIDTGKDGKPVPTSTSTVTLEVEADHGTESQSLDLAEHWWTDNELTMSWAADGRLSGTTQKSTGLGGKVIATGLTLLATAAKLAPMFFLAAPPDAGEIKSIDAILEDEAPDLRKRRTEYAKTLTALEDRLTTVANAVAASAQAEPNLRNQLETLQIALSTARSEAAVIEAQYEVWHAKRFPTWTQTRSYLIGTDELVQRKRVEPTLKLEPDEIAAGGAIEAALLAFGVVVVRVNAHKETKHTAPTDDGGVVVYRRPDRVELAVYEADGDGPPTRESTFKLRSVVPAWVVDSRSEHATIPLRTDFFKKRSATIAFGKAGTLTKVSNSASGSQLIEALGDAPGDFAGGLGDAAKIAKAFPEADDPALAALKSKVAAKELEARLAKANKTIAGAAGAAAPAATD